MNPLTPTQPTATTPPRVLPAGDGDPLDWIVIETCPSCGGLFEHVLGCDRMDVAR